MRRRGPVLIRPAAVLVLLMLALAQPHPGLAAYVTSFRNSVITVSSPSVPGTPCREVLELEGTAELPRVFLCLRAPGGELTVHTMEVTEGLFRGRVWLRFGPGTYTVWLGDNPTYFDGTVRFQVENTSDRDLRFTAPSAYVDSDHPAVVSLAASLTEGAAGDMDRLRALHRWVTTNLAYDARAFLAGVGEAAPASRVLEQRRGTCRDYAFLLAALARAAGLPARVVYGEARPATGGPAVPHAWNEVMVDGRWVTVDAAWDSGYVRDGEFVAAPSERFFDPDPAVFSLTHGAPRVTNH